MAQIIGLPKLSPTMEEGVLVRWVKKEGDKVSPGDLVAEVETDKANMDFNMEDEGTLLKLLVKEGETVKLGAPVAILGNPGEDIAALVAQAAGGGGGAQQPAGGGSGAQQPAGGSGGAQQAAGGGGGAQQAAGGSGGAQQAAGGSGGAQQAAGGSGGAQQPAAPAPAPSSVRPERSASGSERGVEGQPQQKPTAPKTDAKVSTAQAAEAAPAQAPAAQKPPQPSASGSGSGSGSASGSAPAANPSPVRPERSASESERGVEGPRAGAGKLLASPLAKSLALELGVDLRGVQGSGPGGRIVERDVRAAADAGPQRSQSAAAPSPSSVRPERSASEGERGVEGQPQPAQPSADVALVRAPAGPPALAATDDDYVDQPASNMRKRIAARLTEAKRDVPHFYLMRRFDPEALVAFRARLNALLGDRGKVSLNDLIVKAVALALRRLPACNAAWIGDAIRRFNHVHVGIAVAIEDGLVTPVVRDADRKGLSVIAGEVADLAKRARERQLKAHEISGSTFTVSNLGMYDIERFTAIINPPEAGILAVGGIVEEPVVKNGQVVAGKRMTLTMSCDHRVIDGALGARFLAAVVEQLEQPESLAL